MSPWVAAVLLGLAAWLVVPGRARPSAGPRLGMPGRGGRPLASGVLGARRRAAADRAAVLEVCDLLATELASGRPPSSALTAAVEVWPPLAPVAEAHRLGADVPAALRALAHERPAVADLRWVAGAWQVAHHSGQGLAAALERTARGLRTARRTRRVVDSELASARATARLVACLPVAVLLMATGAGSDPWTFLLATPAGWACLGAGLVLSALGLWWIERLADTAAAR